MLIEVSSFNHNYQNILPFLFLTFPYSLVHDFYHGIKASLQFGAMTSFLSQSIPSIRSTCGSNFCSRDTVALYLCASRWHFPIGNSKSRPISARYFLWYTVNWIFVFQFSVAEYQEVQCEWSSWEQMLFFQAIIVTFWISVHKLSCFQY